MQTGVTIVISNKTAQQTGLTDLSSKHDLIGVLNCSYWYERFKCL